jgi:hypothetical protein
MSVTILNLTQLHCVIHQQSFCSLVLDIGDVRKTVEFYIMRTLNISEREKVDAGAGFLT